MSEIGNVRWKKKRIITSSFILRSSLDLLDFYYDRSIILILES